VPDQLLSLWYSRPAGEWLEAVPIGNGRLGGMVYGGVTTERIGLNEDTLWSGGSKDRSPRGRKFSIDHKIINLA
jgi:alpha-L-fucosidase 2